VLALLDAIETVVRVGEVLSKVTDEALVVEVTAVPALPARSEKLIVKVTAPLVSAVLVVYVAVQLLPEGLDMTGVAVTVTAPDLKTTVGDWIVSDDVNERVTTSPTLAKEVLALFEAIETVVRVGTAESTVT
jgi:hypothetical protein